MYAAGKTKSTMTATGDIQNNCPVSLIKCLPLTAGLPAPADLPSTDHYSNGDLYVGMLLTNYQCPCSVLPPGSSTKPNTTHSTCSYHQASCTLISSPLR